MNDADRPVTARQREWYRKGAAAEARLRNSKREALPPKVKEMLDFQDAATYYWTEKTRTPGEVLILSTLVYYQTLSRSEKRAIRRALRGKGGAR